ncbi:reverse transcriptase-like protein [Leptotrombidium deliense]|uniref:Reverse transcriptase-like protein n=1 Tax=Leptotrombidium deliense TaxID=299467 RepID=A0A443SGA8_9ACAR|nr:reverse transcriptase-like protein [Leptotrombidium deliense]
MSAAQPSKKKVFQEFSKLVGNTAGTLKESQVVSMLKSKRYKEVSKRTDNTVQMPALSAPSRVPDSDLLAELDEYIESDMSALKSKQSSSAYMVSIEGAIAERVEWTVCTIYSLIISMCKEIGKKQKIRQRIIGRVSKKGQPLRNNSKGLKRARYLKAQRLWVKNRKACYKLIMEGETESPIELHVDEFHKFWGKAFSGEVSVSAASEPQSDCQVEVLETGRRQDCTSAFKPLTLSEIRTALSKGKRKALGLDGVAGMELCKVPARLLRLFFHLVMRYGYVPPAFKANRTVLIPKGEISADPGAWRPITVASALLRTLHSVLAKRLVKVIQFHPRQKGFVPGDGLLANIQLLDYLLKQKQRSLYLVSLDVSKAFDSVTWTSVHNALKAFGFPEPMIRYLMCTYDGSTTVLQVNGEMSNIINISKGVKQGDPLSPLIFNMIVDNLMYSLPAEVGLPVGAQKVNCLAFADDLVLVAGSRSGLTVLVDAANKFYQQQGLSLNPQKSIFFGKYYHGKLKTTRILQENIVINGREVPNLKRGQILRYLGVNFASEGKLKAQLKIFREALGRIAAAPLKPAQKLYFIKVHYLPKMLFYITTGRLTRVALEYCDFYVRRTVKQVLNLPDWTPNAFFHVPVAKGGLGLPWISATVPMSLRKRLLRLKESTDKVVQEYSKTPEYERLLQQLRRMYPRSWESKQDADKFLLESWHETSNGRDALIFAADKAGNHWLNGTNAKLRGEEFIRFVQLRSNTLPVLANALRGRPTPTCRACGQPGERETLAHILQRCAATHTARVRRHDEVVERCVKEWTRLGLDVRKEPTFTVNSVTYRPDVVLIKGNSIFVIDFAVPIETSVSFRKSYDLKVRKYEAALHSDLVREMCNQPNYVVRFRALIIGAKGAMEGKSIQTAELTNLSRTFQSYLRETAMRGSIKIWKQYRKIMNSSNPRVALSDAPSLAE